MVHVKTHLVSLDLIGPATPNFERMFLIGLKSKETLWLMPQDHISRNIESFLRGYLLVGPNTPWGLIPRFTLLPDYRVTGFTDFPLKNSQL